MTYTGWRGAITPNCQAYSVSEAGTLGEILAKKDKPQQCWARLRLESGEQVMISVAQSGVKVVKMKWAGMLPAATLWQSKTIAEVAEKFFNPRKPTQRPLDSIIDKLIDCRSAAHVVVTLTQE